MCVCVYMPCALCRRDWLAVGNQSPASSIEGSQVESDVNDSILIKLWGDVANLN